jgi:hypothetical protein
MKKNWTDTELQELFEKDPQAFAELARTNEDARLYALLFATFSRLDTPPLPADLSDRVLSRLEVKEAKTRKWQAWSWGVGIALAVVAGIVLAGLLAPGLTAAMGNAALYAPLVLAGILIFVTVEYLDQKMVWRKAEEELLG